MSCHKRIRDMVKKLVFVLTLCCYKGWNISFLFPFGCCYSVSYLSWLLSGVTTDAAALRVALRGSKLRGAGMIQTCWLSHTHQSTTIHGQLKEMLCLVQQHHNHPSTTTMLLPIQRIQKAETPKRAQLQEQRMNKRATIITIVRAMCPQLWLGTHQTV